MPASTQFRRIITLTTDFGLADGFVGTIKGVIARIHPGATVVDLTHQIPPGDVRSGAFALAASYAFFPQSTVHLAIVDPGVGGTRKPIAVQTRHGFFVGPDNGILSWALRHQTMLDARILDQPRFWLPVLSRTFHGRDLFAPVAAHLAAGIALGEMGRPAPKLRALPWPRPRSTSRGIQGQVLYIDHFGNAITNIPNNRLPRHSHSNRPHHVHYQNYKAPVHDAYSAVDQGKPVAVPGSSGFLEIALFQGNLARLWDLKSGSIIEVRTKS